MITASVSNLDLYRAWSEEEDLDLAWILQRILRPEQTEAMKVGEAFHKALETAQLGELGCVEAGGYRFEFQCECEVELAPARELFVTKPYGELTVRGRVDAIAGKRVTDFKTTAQFDPDRLMTGYQWRFYLDMMEADTFRWDVFVLRDTNDPELYLVNGFHRLEQKRYPKLHEDCTRLASEYVRFAREHMIPQKELFPREVA